MRKLIVTAAASAAMTALSFLPVGSAQAMAPGSASGVRAALAQTDLTQSVARCYRDNWGRLICRRGGYYSGYYGSPYYGYPYYGGYYGPGVGVWGPGFGVGIGVGPRWGW
jgi:hypothetical protein